MPAGAHGAIFDLDGVLTDTAESHYVAWRSVADELGIPFTPEDNLRLRGVSRRESLELLLGDRELEPDVFEDVLQRKNERYVESIGRLTPDDTLPGAVELVEELRRRGYRTAIASASRNTPMVVDRLQIGGLFDAIVDGSMAERSKPAPDVFLLAAEQLGLPPAACVVLEDAESGVQAARAAGMAVIGIGGDELADADLVVARVADLAPDAVAGLLDGA